MTARVTYDTILLISPQLWTESRVSKHHYAEHLAQQGHQVFFLEPPRPDVSKSAQVSATSTRNLFIVSYNTWFPYQLKFRWRWLFDKLMRWQAKIILESLPHKPDLVWDFDNAYQFIDLRVFGATLNVFHPVDDLPEGIISSKFADVVFSNAQRYLDRIPSLPQFSSVIDHGLSPDFLNRALEITKQTQHFAFSKPHSAKIGYVGNLKRPGIDWEVILESCLTCPSAKFLFIGPYEERPTGALSDVMALQNVVFLGPKTTPEILEVSRHIDVWFMAYDRKQDIDGGTNPHKLLEYLATGSVVVTNWVEAYHKKDLIIMPETSSNKDLPSLLHKTISELEIVNSAEERARRASYALGFGYDSHLRRIHEVFQEAIAFKRVRLGK